MSEEVKIEITADSAAADPALKGTAAGVATIATASKAAAPAVRGLAGTIDTLRLSLSGVQKAFALLAIINMVISMLIRVYEACKTAYQWFEKLGKTSAADALDLMAASAKRAAGNWKALNDEMARNAAQRKALVDDEQKRRDADFSLGSAQIEERLQKDLASTTDPAKRAAYQTQADADQKSLSSLHTVQSAKAAESALDAEMAANRAARAEMQKRLSISQKQSLPINTWEVDTPEDVAAARKIAQAKQKREADLENGLKENESKYDRLRQAKASARAITAAAELRNSATMTQTDSETAAAEAPASASESSASNKDPDSNPWFSRAQAKAAAAREIAEIEASIAVNGKTPADSAALRAARERAAAAEAAIHKANDDLDATQSAARDTIAKANIASQSKRADILAAAAEKERSVTVDAPRAATDVTAIGGYMGGAMQNAARMAEQRAAALEAIQREALTLLAKIKEGISE